MVETEAVVEMVVEVEMVVLQLMHSMSLELVVQEAKVAKVVEVAMEELADLLEITGMMEVMVRMVSMV
jgi:hypothetical protein